MSERERGRDRKRGREREGEGRKDRQTERESDLKSERKRGYIFNYFWYTPVSLPAFSFPVPAFVVCV